MSYNPATHGGPSGAVSCSALKMSENQHEVAGVSSGVGNNAAGNSSLHEGQYNGSAVSPVPSARNVANTVSSSAMDRTLTTENGMLSREERVICEDMSGASSRSSRSLEEIAHDLITTLARVPPEDMSAASTASSCTAPSGSSPDVNNAPLDGASQQIGNMALGSSAGLPELGPGEDWSLEHPGVEAFERQYMAEGSSTTVSGNGCMGPRVLMGSADNANITVENAPTVPLAGSAQPAVAMDPGSSTINDALPPVNGGYLVGGAQADGQMGASNSASNSFAQDATFGVYGQPSQQTGASSSANNPVAPNATFGGFTQPQMQMGAGNSVNTFAGQQYNFGGVSQQYNIAAHMYGQQQTAFNGGVAPFDSHLNAAPQAYFYHVAANTTPYNGVMGQCPLPPAYQAGSVPGNCVGQQQQQQQALNGNVLQHMGQDWPAAALQPAAPITVARIRRRQGDANAPRRHRRAGPAPAAPAPAVQAPAVQALAGPAAAPAPGQQQVPAQVGPFMFTAAGVPNLNPNRKGNAQGQVPGWGQAFKHHDNRCERYRLNGCVPDCEVRARWPKTWADWNSRHFRIRWKQAQNDRPETEETLSGFAVYAERKNKRFVVLGEFQADGKLGEAKGVHRVDREMVRD
jgi:hypothetical protein